MNRHTAAPQHFLRVMFWVVCLAAGRVYGSDGLAIESPRALHPSDKMPIGFYHWGGKHTSGLQSGIEQISQMNAKFARITLSARIDVDYHRGSSCRPNFRLTHLLDDADVRTALGDPAIQIFMLTAYDGLTYPDCDKPLYLQKSFYTETNIDRVAAEYEEFTYRVHRDFAGSGKVFVLSNWEGDNAVYCGSVMHFTNNKEFERSCLENYPAWYAGNQTPHDSILGFRSWLNARHAGVTKGNLRARNEGLADVSVYTAPEISSVQALRERGLESVLDHVLPYIAFDFVSYSAYESVNKPDAPAQLRADLNSIAAVARTRNIIIGEFGFSRAWMADRMVTAIHELLQAAREWGVAGVVQWNLYDQSEAVDFGIFDLQGRPTSLARYYRELLQPTTTNP